MRNRGYAEFAMCRSLIARFVTAPPPIPRSALRVPRSKGSAFLRVRLGLAQAHHFVARLELTTFLEQFDAFEPFEHISFGGNGAGAFETAML